MIYIIDDKPDRQRRLAPHLIETKNIKLIYQYDGEFDAIRKEMFRLAKVIAIHDSFFKNPVNKHPTKSEDIIRKDLKEYCYSNHINLVLFSGDYFGYSESKGGLECQIAVTRFYANLNNFVKHIENGGEPVLAILGFGKNYRIELTVDIYIQLRKKIEANDESQARILLTKLCEVLEIEDYKSLEVRLHKNETSELINKIDPYLLSFYENISY